MMHPRIDNLFFIGLFQPIGCIWRLADRRARIAALQIGGRLPRPADITACVDKAGPPAYRRGSTGRSDRGSARPIVAP
jgi:hypothetical protein